MVCWMTAQLAEIEREVNERVWEDKEVVITYPDAEELKTIDYRSKKELTGQVRIVTFPGSRRMRLLWNSCDSYR